MAYGESPQFFSPIYEKEFDLQHTEQNLTSAAIGSGGGAIGALVMGALGFGPVGGMAVLAGALTGAVPGLMKEGVQQVMDPQYTQQFQSQLGRGTHRGQELPPGGLVHGLQSPQQGVQPWTPGFMNQMARYG